MNPPAEGWDALENASVGLVPFVVGIHAMLKIDYDEEAKINMSKE